MTTPAKLYGKDLNEYDDVDVDTLLAQLSPEEINILAKEVDPDVSAKKKKKKNFKFTWLQGQDTSNFYHRPEHFQFLLKSGKNLKCPVLAWLSRPL